jgi:hypothetical protein
VPNGHIYPFPPSAPKTFKGGDGSNNKGGGAAVRQQARKRQQQAKDALGRASVSQTSVPHVNIGAPSAISVLRALQVCEGILQAQKKTGFFFASVCSRGRVIGTDASLTDLAGPGGGKERPPHRISSSKERQGEHRATAGQKCNASQACSCESRACQALE